MEDYKKSFWKDAAKAGGVLGLAIFGFYALSMLLKLEISAAWTKSTFEFMAIAITIYYYGKRRAELYGNDGFTYAQSLSYILAMMLFAGVIVGFGQFILQTAAPEYYQEVMDIAMAKQGVNIDSQALEQSMDLVMKMMKNPIVMVLSGIFGMLIYGLFIGILASIFIKRPANIFTNDNQ